MIKSGSVQYPSMIDEGRCGKVRNLGNSVVVDDRYLKAAIS